MTTELTKSQMKNLGIQAHSEYYERAPLTKRAKKALAAADDEDQIQVFDSVGEFMEHIRADFGSTLDGTAPFETEDRNHEQVRKEASAVCATWQGFVEILVYS